MQFDVFCKRIKDEFLLQIPNDNCRAIIQDVLKNNGKVYTGMLIINDALNVSPTIYLDAYYQRYLEGVDFMDIVYDIVDSYEETRPKENFDIEHFKNWNTAKERIVAKLINYDMNKELLEDVPHKKVEDLAVIYQYAIDSFLDDYATILIHNNVFELYDVSLDELDKIAMENTKQIHPYEFKTMSDMLNDFIQAPLPFVPEIEMYVLTNKIKINGAISILNKDAQDEIGKRMGDKCYIIPSSVHEVLVVPYDIDYTYDELNEMIAEVNEFMVGEDEILSFNSYVLDTKNHVLLRSDREAEYEKELQKKAEKENEVTKELEKKKEEPMVGPKL